MGNFTRLTRHPLCRLVTHIVVFVIYLCLGAAVFQLLEGPEEVKLVTDLRMARDSFSDLTHECVSGKHAASASGMHARTQPDQTEIGAD